MAEQRLAELFEGLSGAIGTLATNVGTQGVGTKIEVYSGEPKVFKEWIKAMEKYALLTNADGAQTKFIAYQASKGAVSDFIHCYITTNPNSTWNQLKDELSDRFLEIQDSQHAFTLLRQTRQKLVKQCRCMPKGCTGSGSFCRATRGSWCSGKPNDWFLCWLILSWLS